MKVAPLAAALALALGQTMALPVAAGGISLDLPRLTFPDPVLTPSTKGCPDPAACPKAG